MMRWDNRRCEIDRVILQIHRLFSFDRHPAGKLLTSAVACEARCDFITLSRRGDMHEKRAGEAWSVHPEDELCSMTILGQYFACMVGSS